MLNAKIAGNGLPLVFIHGYGEDLSLWHELSLSLSKKHKVITFDLPGFGKSKPLETPFDLNKIAEIVHDYITKSLQIQQFLVFGHSLGGYISLTLAELYPDSIMALGLINSTSFADSEEKKNNRVKTVDFINKHGSSFFLQSFVPNLFTSGNQQILTEDVSKVLQMGVNLPNSVLTDYMMAMRNRPDRSYLLSKIENVIFIAGLQDQHISYKDITSQISLLKHSQHGHIFNNTAHMSMYESVTELNNALINFIQDIKLSGNRK